MLGRPVPAHIHICLVTTQINTRKHIRRSAWRPNPREAVPAVEGNDIIRPELRGQHAGAVGAVLLDFGVGAVAHDAVAIGELLQATLGGGVDLLGGVSELAHGADLARVRVHIEIDTRCRVRTVEHVGVVVGEDAEEYVVGIFVADARVVLVGEVQTRSEGEVAAGCAL